LRQAVEAAHLGIGGEQGVVIPDVSSADGREISDDGEEDQQRGEGAGREGAEGGIKFEIRNQKLEGFEGHYSDFTRRRKPHAV
jgi:hypothetical protein